MSTIIGFKSSSHRAHSMCAVRWTFETNYRRFTYQIQWNIFQPRVLVKDLGDGWLIWSYPFLSGSHRLGHTTQDQRSVCDWVGVVAFESQSRDLGIRQLTCYGDFATRQIARNFKQ